MVLVILLAEGDLRGLVETMLGYVEPKTIKQPDEDPPFLMSRFDLEVGVGLLSIQSCGIFNQKRGGSVEEWIPPGQ